MRQIIIDKEFQELLPPLDADTYSLDSGLPKTVSNADKAKLKASLKSCIDRLEGLYGEL